MDWIAGNSLYKSSPYTRQQQQSTMHAVNIYNTQYRISYSKGNNSSLLIFFSTLICYLKVLPVYDVARFITSQFNLNT